MFIQTSDVQFINLAHVAYVEKQTSIGSGDSYHFYNANKVLLLNIDWGSTYNENVAKELEIFGRQPVKFISDKFMPRLPPTNPS